jgi:AAA-like domain
MSRSLTVRPEYIGMVKTKVKQLFPRQKDLAEELWLSLATVSNFLNGKPVDHLNFLDICEKLGLSWQGIAKWDDMNHTVDCFVEILPNYIDDGSDRPSIYVERSPIEANFLAEILRPGGLIRIKAPSLMGKTALASKIIEQVSQKGYRYVDLNFHLATEEHLSDLGSFLKWFCAGASQSLGLPNTLKDYWDEELYTSKIICTEYFEKYLLANSEGASQSCRNRVISQK